MAAPAQLSADQSNKHTEKYQSLYKSWKKRQDGKSSTVMWDYFKPMLIYGDPPAEGQPKPVVGVKVQTLCDKLLSAGNVSDTFSGHKNCQKCKQKLEELKVNAGAGSSRADSSASVNVLGKRSITDMLQQQPMGGAADLELLSKVAKTDQDTAQASIRKYCWDLKKQDEFDTRWTYAAIADNDSFNAASSNSAKSEVLEQFCGLRLPCSKKMAGPSLDKAAKIAAQQRADTLGAVNGFQYAYDGGKDKHIGGGFKMINTAALTPDNKAVYLDTINTYDCRLGADTYSDLLKANVNQYGGFGKVTALMSDREAVCVRTSTDLQEEHPHLMLTWCQGHASNNLVGDLRKLPAVDDMFDACHLIIGAICTDKVLNRAFKEKAKALSSSGYLRLAPSHRFAYQIDEADDVSKNFSALREVAESHSLRRQCSNKDSFDDFAGYINGSSLLGSGSNMFTLRQLLDSTLPALRKIKQAISTLEANRAQNGIVESMWRNLKKELGVLAAAVQASQRGGGAAATRKRLEQIENLVDERHKQYRSPATILGALLDPINSVAPTDGGLRKPPLEWFTEAELQTAYDEVERVATAIGRLPATQLPDEITPEAYGLNAVLALQKMVVTGFPETTIGICGVPKEEEKDGKKVVSIKWAGSSQRRIAVVHMLTRAGEKGLLAVADRVLSLHATVCAVDRAWSQLGNIFPANRTRLAIAKANKMMVVRNSYRLSKGITLQDKEVERAFWIEDLAEADDDEEVEIVG